MADIIIGDEDNFGKKGIQVKVLDVSTLPTSAQGDTAYVNPSKHYGSLNRNPSLNWDKTNGSLGIMPLQQSLSRKHLEPKVDVIIGDKVLPFMSESREASKALLKKWEDKGQYRPFPILSTKHTELKKDVVVDGLNKDFDGDVFNIEQLWPNTARIQPKKDITVEAQSTYDLILDYIEQTASKSVAVKIREKASLAKSRRTHQNIIKDITVNKSNPDDVIVE